MIPFQVEAGAQNVQLKDTVHDQDADADTVSEIEVFGSTSLKAVTCCSLTMASVDE